MRIWDISPKLLCRKHLLGEHRELHAIWTILTTDKKGYRNHPETKRWEGKLAALYKRHEDEVKAMIGRNYSHSSPLDKKLASGKATQDTMINTIEEQINLLKNKGCDCYKL
jgi:hypothetical protein